MILLLALQFTKLLLTQLGKTDMGFHLLLFIFKTKKYPLLLPYAYETNKIGGSFQDHHVVNEF